MGRVARVYLPATLTMVRSLRVADGMAGKVPACHGHAVTGALRRRLPRADDEELAYEAYRAAAWDSLHLLGDDPDAPKRRVVVAADLSVSEGVAAPVDQRSDGDTAVTVSAVPLSAVASFHVDGLGAEPDVAAAVAALPAAAAGDAGAQAALEAAEEYELEWFDVSELDQLLVG